MPAVAKLCCDGVLDAVGVTTGRGAAGIAIVTGVVAGRGVTGVAVVAEVAIVAVGTVLTVVRDGVTCFTRILELTGVSSLICLSIAAVLPPLEGGVLCVERVPDAEEVAATPPGVVAALLISDPVCEPSRRAEVMGAAPVLLVTAVDVDRAEVACGP